jgi:thioredoxin reductase (NADPH)
MIDPIMAVHDILIIGSGPAGLSTAIAARQRNLSYLVVERGALVNSISKFPTNMVFFTTPELLEVGGVPFTTPYEKPTRFEALRYYRKVADAHQVQIAFGETVEGVRPVQSGTDEAGADEARLSVTTRDVEGVTREHRARTVVLATGAYDRPNRLDIPGEDLPHVNHYYTEAHPHWRKHVVIVGGQNSAAEAALDLYRNGARVTIVHRKPEFGTSLKYWVKPDIENRVREGSVAARFNARLIEIKETSVVMEQKQADGTTVTEDLPADAVFLLTGYRSDTALLTACGVAFNPTTFEPEYDADTFESNVPGLFLAGQVLTGRQSGKIFIENGRFHGERVVEVIARRLGVTTPAPPVVPPINAPDTVAAVAAAAKKELVSPA